MSFILGQILVCLLIAGLIGAILGWLLRGGCSSKLRDCEDECKMKLGSLESEYNSKLQRQDKIGYTKEVENKEQQAATLKRHAAHVESQAPSYSYEKELQERLNLEKSQARNSVLTGSTTLAGAAALGSSTLIARNISLDDEKVALYAEHDVDFETAQDLEDDYDIRSLEGVNHKHSEKLKIAGFTSTKDLTTLSQDAESSEKLAKTIGVEPEVLESWIGKSCLLELPGVNAKTADLLHNSGITSTHIASSTPQELQAKLHSFSKDALVPVTLPDVKTVSLWSKIAKPVATTSVLGASAAALASATTSDLEAEHIPNVSNYAQELQAKLNIEPNFDASGIRNILASRNIDLSDDKLQLYAENGINFEEGLYLEDNYDIQSIEGVGPKYAQNLRDMGINTTQELVKKLIKNNDKIDQIAKTLQIQPEVLSSWISMADLIQLPGVDGQVAELMQTVGITTARELGITNASSLHTEMVSFNKKSPIVPKVPSVESLGLWSKIAKLLG